MKVKKENNRFNVETVVANYHFGTCNIDDVVLCHTLPVFMGLGWCPIVNWDFAGAVSIF